jgi:hypothetical protein
LIMKIMVASDSPFFNGDFFLNSVGSTTDFGHKI